jgi:hypothetical protein
MYSFRLFVCSALGDSRSAAPSVPYFVPHLGRKPSQMVSEVRLTEKALQVRKINVVAGNHAVPELGSWLPANDAAGRHRVLK